MTKQIKAKLSEVQGSMASGDALLFRGGWKPSSILIGGIGRSDYVHVGMIDGDCILHMLQFRGGQTELISDIVARHPGRWDWFVSNPEARWPEFDRGEAVKSMRESITRPYGYLVLFFAMLRRLPIIRLIIPPLTNDEANGSYPPFCSVAVARACRNGGVDPVPNCADRVTEPGDLARSTFFEYRYTLIP